MALSVDSFERILEEYLPSLRKMEEILSIFGLAFLGKFVLGTVCEILQGIKTHFLSRLFKKNYVEKYGKWAVVTGCTDGIGKAYMGELAKNGLDIILISRNMAKLENCAMEIREKYGVKTEIVQADFSEGKPIYENIAKSLIGKEIGILVNNVGVMLDKPKAFGKVTDTEIWSHINVNMASIPCMMKMVLPTMIARKKGAIVNIASIAACGPCPYMGIYSASKAFVDYFSEACCDEYAGSGVTIQTLTPSYIATNMTSFNSWVGSSNLLVPSAQVYANHALNTLGYSKRTTGFWPFGIQMWTNERFMTRSMFMCFTKGFNKFLSKDKLHFE